MPLLRFCLIVFALLLLYPPLPAAARNVHVAPHGDDANDGSADRPWRTIEHAGDVVGPGTTVFVAPGVYEGGVTTRRSGTAADRIRYVSTTKWAAVITGTADSLWHNRGSYVDIEGFDVTGPVARIGISNHGHAVRIIGNRVRDVSMTECIPHAGGAGILHNPRATDSDVLGNVVINIGPPRSVPCNLVHGIYHSTQGGRIQNNLVFGVRTFGIHLYHAANGPIAITNNLVAGSGRSGMIIGGVGPEEGGWGDNILVANNLLVENGEFGIVEGGDTGPNNRYLHNLFWQNGASNYRLHTGIDFGGAVTDDPRFVNYQPDGSGDYRLQSGSPAIRAGTSEGAPPDDHDGVARPSESAIDIGPFQLPSWSSSPPPGSSWPPPWSDGLVFHVSPAGNDTGDGSGDQPWRTLQHAADQLVPGATVYVAPGVYTEDVVSRIGGTAAARVRFVAYPKWGAKIVGSGALVWINSADYVDIEGFEITTLSHSRLGIYNRGSFVRIIGNHVHHLAPTGALSDGGAGIESANPDARDVAIIGNIVHDIGDLSLNSARVQGIKLTHPGGSIQNNIVYRIQSFGIHLWHAATDAVIANNLVFRTFYGGILVGGSSGVADNCIVVNNISFDNTRSGILENGRTGPNNRYLHNLVYGNGQNWRLLTGSQSGTVTADPQFVDYRPEGGGDYRLSGVSPGIDAGTSEAAPLEDFNGVARPQGARWTIGPYERS